MASPDLNERFVLRDPDSLSATPFIANGALSDPLTWHFSRNDLERRAVLMRRVMVVNSAPAVLAALLAVAFPCYPTFWWRKAWKPAGWSRRSGTCKWQTINSQDMDRQPERPLD